MKLLSGFSLILLVSLALSGCDHGYGSPGFSTTTLVFDCSSTATNNGTTACIPAGSGGSTSDPTNTVTVITTDNYQVLAAKVSDQIDRLIRPRVGNPPSLAEMGLLLLQRIQDDTVTVCSNNANNVTVNGPIVANTVITYNIAFDNTDGCVIDGISTKGSLVISNFTANGTLTNEFEIWNASASINIGSLRYDISPGLTYYFLGNVDITVANDGAAISTALTLTNLGVGEINSGVNTVDTFTTAQLNSTDGTNDLAISIFNASMDNTSVTQSTLNITSSGTPQLTWDKFIGSDNPITGQLFVTSSDNSSTLTLSAVDADTMSVILNNSQTDCLTWANLNPGNCP